MDFPSSPLLGSSGAAIVINLFDSAIYEELHISGELARAALASVRQNFTSGREIVSRFRRALDHCSSGKALK
jgi:hypothetical protein